MKDISLNILFWIAERVLTFRGVGFGLSLAVLIRVIGRFDGSLQSIRVGPNGLGLLLLAILFVQVPPRVRRSING